MMCKKTFGLCVAVFVMAAYALSREFHIVANPDNSWLLYAAGRMLDGQKLYVDILETNPPLIVWLSAPAVALARILSVAPEYVFAGVVTLLNLSMIAFASRFMPQPSTLKNGLLLYIAAAFFLFSNATYGERELLWLALILPYLVQSFGNEIPRVSVALLAAIGFALKPFFLIFWAVNEVFSAYEKRALRALFSLQNWIIGIIQLAYVAAIYHFTPDYITSVFPALTDTYFAYNQVFSEIWQFLVGMAIAVGLLAWLTKPQGTGRVVVTRAMVWMAAYGVIMCLQRKMWMNHVYPMMFFAGLACVALLVYLVDELCTLKLDIGHRKFIALCQVVVLLLGTAYIQVKFAYRLFAQPSVIDTRLLAEINQRAAGQGVYPLSFGLATGFPVIAQSQGVFRGGFHHLWPLAGLIIREQQGEMLPKAREFFFDALVRDFTQFPPKLVWVEPEAPDHVAGYEIKPENRDMISLLTRDARFEKLWKNYHKVGEVVGEPEKNADEDEKDAKKPTHYMLFERNTP